MASVKARVLSALQTGPVTAGDIAARIGHRVQPCRVLLSQLCRLGVVSRAGTAPNDRSRSPTLYVVPERGEG